MRQFQAKSNAGAPAAAHRPSDAQAVRLEQLAFEALLADLIERLSGVTQPDFVSKAEWALRRLVAFLGYDRCTFSEFVAGDYLNVLCSVGAGDFEALPRGRFQYPFRWFFNELRGGRIVALSRLPDDLPSVAIEEAEHCRRTGLRSHISIPVRVGGRVTSVLSLAAMRQATTCPPELVARLKIVAELFGSAFSLVRLEEEAGQLRRRVWHADRVQRVSALTAAIAHDLNQPLAAILSNAQAGLKYLAREDATPAAIKEILEAVVREDKRAAETIRAMRALIRQQNGRSERIDLAASLGDTKRLLESEFAERGCCIDTHFDEGCWITGDKVQMEQVALNLLLNAATAVQDGPLDRRLIRLRVSRSDERITMSVSDAGKGIFADDLRSIFEPFWSTRQEGLGLGLAICRSIVEAHNGRIWAESNAEGGATFNVELPAVPGGAHTSDGPRQEDMLTTATARERSAPTRREEALVCVVDDDPAVRSSLLRLLDGAGCAGVGYASADEFLGNPPAGDVACILLDIQMPGLSGPQLQQRLLGHGRRPPIIFITGNGDVAAGVDAMKQGAADFLEKPVDGDILLAAVRRAVERHADERKHATVQEALQERVALLTVREREIMVHVIRGRLNKQIASDLLIAEQTVKQHRGRVMEKMGVRSVPDLVRACESAGLSPIKTLLQLRNPMEGGDSSDRAATASKPEPGPSQGRTKAEQGRCGRP